MGLSGIGTSVVSDQWPVNLWLGAADFLRTSSLVVSRSGSAQPWPFPSEARSPGDAIQHCAYGSFGSAIDPLRGSMGCTRDGKQPTADESRRFQMLNHGVIHTYL